MSWANKLNGVVATKTVMVEQQKSQSRCAASALPSRPVVTIHPLALMRGSTCLSAAVISLSGNVF